MIVLLRLLVPERRLLSTDTLQGSLFQVGSDDPWWKCICPNHHRAYIFQVRKMTMQLNLCDMCYREEI